MTVTVMLGVIAVVLTLLAAAPDVSRQHWRAWRGLPGVVDLGATGFDGRFIASAAGRLWLIDNHGRLSPFARGPDGYRGDAASEPYLAVAPTRPTRTPCRWQPGDVAILQTGPAPGVVLVHADGRETFLASIPKLVPDGIAFDGVGRFGGQLLVTAINSASTTILTIGCDGRVRRLAQGAPHMEGGIVVAPAGFGLFGGDLIAPDELAGRIYAVAPSGRVVVVVRSRFARGPDIGIESLGFVPAGATAALVADRGTPNNPHPGTDSILTLSTRAARLSPGDLLAVDEGGGQAAAIRCAARCTTRVLVAAQTTSHIEGHVVFLTQR